MATSFMFATGIECSYPTVPNGDGTSRRVDELALTGHYERWREDFRLTKELGLRYLRYGPPYYKVHRAPGSYDWSFVDETFGALREMGIEPIADLCHFGVPEWVGDFQNEDWPHLFAEFARAFAERYPWVRLYTPVNEIFTAARNSGMVGKWNEGLCSHRGFVRALTNLCKANLLAMKAILEVRPDATFVQSEASQYNHPLTPAASEEAYLQNGIRFLSLDLTYSYPVAAPMYRYLLDNGMREDEYQWLYRQTVRGHCIMGTDYYGLNEHFVDESGRRVRSGTILGYGVVCRQYYSRYQLPIMLTETNTYAEQAPEWLDQTWGNVYRLKMDGLPVVGYAWYSLTDQVDWDSSLVENNGHVDSFGLFDLDRNIREVGKEYRKLVSGWSEALNDPDLNEDHQRW